MTKPISARVHGVLDYAAVAAFLNAPMVFGFKHTTASVIAYWLCGIHLLLTGCTDFLLGAFKWIPFRIHVVLEAVAGLIVQLATSSHGFGHQPACQGLFVPIGPSTFKVIALTENT